MQSHFKHHEHRFPDVGSLAKALAGEIRVDLVEALSVRQQASLAVSGGRTPGPLFDQLAREDLDWSRVWVTLTDDRWVDPSSDQSNEWLARSRLLQGTAATARFVPLKNPAATPEAGCEWAWRALTRMPRPYDVVILGMGMDGHFASLFPASIGVAKALDVNAAPGCLAMHALAVPHARISQNLAALLDARRIVLMMTGEDKWALYQRAKTQGSSAELPIRALLHQQNTPVDVYWAPQ